MRRSRLLTSAALATLLAVTSPAVSADEELPYSIEAWELLTYAFSMLKEQYPTVSANDVRLAQRVSFHCHSSSHVAGPEALSQARFGCSAMVNFDLSSTEVEWPYYDAEGNCLIADPPKYALMHISQNGSTRIKPVLKGIVEDQVVECDDEIITRIAILDRRLPGSGEPFSIDAHAVLEAVFAVAVDAYPDIPFDQFVYVSSPSLSVTCETVASAGGLTPIDLDIGPCTASARLANELEKFEYRYLTGTNCMLGKSTDSITVSIDEEGHSEIHYQELTGGGRRHSVECDEDFYNSPLPLIEAPD